MWLFTASFHCYNTYCFHSVVMWSKKRALSSCRLYNNEKTKIYNLLQCLRDRLVECGFPVAKILSHKQTGKAQNMVTEPFSIVDCLCLTAALLPTTPTKQRRQRQSLHLKIPMDTRYRNTDRRQDKR